MQRFVQVPPPDVVDSHVHLDRYTDDAVRRMVAEAEAAGVAELLTIGTSLPSSQAALRLAGLHDTVRAAVGVHPTRLAALIATTGEQAAGQQLRLLLEACAQAGSGVQPAAIGEVGLDDSAPDLSGQAHFLADCLTLAAERALPLVLHVVGALATHEAALGFVRQYPSARVVAHYFVGGPDLARRYLDAGCWLAVGRPVTRLTEAAVRAAVRLVPPDRLLLETDTYPLPGRTTEPRDVTTVCAAVADLRGEPYAMVARTTTAAYRAFLGI
jgi:TatD DNase family protein